MTHDIPHTASTRCHIYGARLENGDRGANGGVRRRLAGAPPPPLDETDVPEAGADYLYAKAREREQAKLDAIPDPDYDPEDGINARKAASWPDADVGMLLRLLAGRATIEQMAVAMHRTHAAVKQKVYSLRQLLALKSKAEAASMSRHNGHG